MRKVLLCAWAAGMVIVGCSAIASESTDWLKNNPVSMMDWGIRNIHEAVQKVIGELNVQMEGREKFHSFNDPLLDPQKYGYHFEFGYAQYDRDNDRIQIGSLVIPSVSKHSNKGKVDADSCTVLVEDFRKVLLRYGGYTGDFSADGLQQAVVNWFAQYGHSATTPPNFWKDLVAHITVEMSLSAKIEDYPPLIKCTESLAGGEVTVVNTPKK